MCNFAGTKKELMKKMMRTLAAVLCCVMLTTVFTSCKKDRDEFNYKIFVRPGGNLSGDAAVNWTQEVISTYQAALNIDSDEFTMKGSEEECDKQVFDTCKKAEASLRVGGAGEIQVHNSTTNRTVYRREIQ